MKFKITMTFTRTYEVNPAHYPGGSTAQEMLDLDIEGSRGDPYLFIDNEGKISFVGEVLED